MYSRTLELVMSLNLSKMLTALKLEKKNCIAIEGDYVKYVMSLVWEWKGLTSLVICAAFILKNDCEQKAA